MPRIRKQVNAEPLPNSLPALGRGSSHYRWVVLVIAIVIELAVIVVVYLTDATVHPLTPAGASVVAISILAAGFGGVLVGLIAALVAVIASFLLLADFGSSSAIANAIGSALIWCGAATATGLVARHLRRQVTNRETALQQALSQSLYAREKMERLLDFSPQFHQKASLAEAGKAICETAVETFGVDGARLYAVRGDAMELLALVPASPTIKPGFKLLPSDFPDLEAMLRQHRPSFVRNIEAVHPSEPALRLGRELNIVSTIRAPIVSPDGAVGVLGLGWDHAIEQPTEEFMAIMQRFADQAAVAWQNALRAEAQSQADQLRETLDRVLAVAPTFHITGSREALARAICEAALATFDCSGAGLYRVEGDRLRVLDRLPPLTNIKRGQTFPLSEDMPMVHEIRSGKPTFIADVLEPSRSRRPWPPEVVRETGTRSTLYVPTRFTERGPRNLLVLAWNERREEPDEGFLVVVERFADQAALALTNASAERLHARLERSLLPSAPVDHPLLNVTTRYRTGEQRLQLGGDFVGSTVGKNDSLNFVIGDVSGHGPDAAALGATLRSTWKALVLAGRSGPRIVSVMREVLLAERTEPGAFATIIAGHIDLRSRSISFVNAGHPPPLVISDRVVSLDTRPASPLGFNMDRDPPLHRFELPENWSFFCYTDGLIDARLAPGAPQRYGEERLKQRLSAWADRRPNGAALDALMDEIETASGGPFPDDVALLLVSPKQGEHASSA